MFRSRIIEFAIVLGLAIGPAVEGSAGPVEERCTELGSRCVCSEPLNFPLSPKIAPIDPTDSEGSGAKECNNGDAMTGLNGAAPVDTVPGSTLELPGIGHVLRVRTDGGGSHFLKDLNRTFTDATFCYRLYRRIADEGTGPSVSGDDNYKWATFSGGNAPGISHGFNPGRGVQYRATSNFTMPSGTIGESGGGSISVSEAQKAWIRLEFCFDHNWDGSDRMQVRSRFTNIETGEVGQWPARISSNGLSSANTGSSRNWPGWFKIDYKASGANEPDYNYATHFMAAKQTPANPNFWIGSANEIEGAGNNPPPPPPPPPPTPPAAPVLLD